VWFSGVDTTRGAASKRGLAVLRISSKPFASVSCRRGCWGGGMNGSASIGAGSPSKKRAMAI